MRIAINGQHMSVGESLQTYVTDRLQNVVSRYFNKPISGTVHFTKNNFQFDTEILVNEGTGRHIVLKGNAVSDDVYNSFDSALIKIEKQLRKYKSKISHHKDNIKTADAIDEIAGIKYIISPYTREDEDTTDDNPVIIAEKATKVHTLTVSDAVMRMDLENLPALLFKNAKTSRVNVVYYRKDGNISWVDTADM